MQESSPTTSENEDRKRNQFSLFSVLVVTASVAMVLSYSQWLGGDAPKQAIIYASFASAIGLGLGWIAGNWRDSLFWSLLMTLLAYLAVAGGRLPNVAVFYGWGIIGAICGSMSVLTVPKNQLLASLLMGIVSCLAMILTIASFRFPFNALVLFDVASAAILGAIIHPFLHFLQWFERRSGHPRILLACWLTISVLVGNFLVLIVGGVDR